MQIHLGIMTAQIPSIEIGRLAITRLAGETLDPRDVFYAIERHVRGDWGRAAAIKCALWARGGEFTRRFVIFERTVISCRWHDISVRGHNDQHRTFLLPEEY